ncbi:hypothetical protein [Pseudoflavonifractor gallinarum]|uniref:hypothetical protein n=1 Tax=Pseudoflavonifractor gallinarum TaxID=2779352 RepID=UPI0036F2B68C
MAVPAVGERTGEVSLRKAVIGGLLLGRVGLLGRALGKSAYISVKIADIQRIYN